MGDGGVTKKQKKQVFIVCSLALYPLLMFAYNAYNRNLEKSHGVYCGWTYVERQDMLNVAIARQLRRAKLEEISEAYAEMHGRGSIAGSDPVSGYPMNLVIAKRSGLIMDPKIVFSNAIVYRTKTGSMSNCCRTWRSRQSMKNFTAWLFPQGNEESRIVETGIGFGNSSAQIELTGCGTLDFLKSAGAMK
jgi:hypothetical protein